MRRGIIAGLSTGLLLLSACTGSPGQNSSSPSPGGKVTIQFWHAQTDIAATVMQNLVARFNATHPNIVVQASSGGVTTGDLLPKVTVAMAAGTYPDIAYIYG